MFYIRACIKSLYDKDWIYSQKNNTKQSATYIMLLILVLSIVFSIFSSFQIYNVLRFVKNDIVNNIPDFEIQVDDGLLTVNTLEQPFVYPFEIKKNPFILYVDTVTTSSLSISDLDIDMNKNIILITQKEMMMFDVKTNSTEVSYFTDIPNKVITKSDIEKTFINIVNRKALLVSLIILITFVLFSISKLLYLLILIFITYIIQRFFKKNLTFGELFRMGLFAITGPSIIDIILRISGYSVPYLYTLLVCIYLLSIVFFHTNKKLSEKNNSIEPIE